MRRHPEHDEQTALFVWAKYVSDTGMYPLKCMFAVPNSARRSPRQGAWMKDEGLLAGTWDIFLPEPIAPYSGLFIEMKSGKNKLTPAQLLFREYLKDKYHFAVCYSFVEAKDAIILYLAGKRF